MTLSEAARQPVFLLGFPRSGTTLLRLFLDAHPDLAIPFESFVLIDFAAKASSYAIETRDGRVRLIDDLLASKGIGAWNPRVERGDFDLERCDTYAGIVNELFSSYARRSGKQVWGDKTPSYTKDIDILYRMFPRARVVNLIRDGRDASESLVRQPWGPGDLITALTQWNEIVGWSRKLGRMLPEDQYLEVRFEDLAADPEGVLRRIVAFLGLPFDPIMLKAQEHAGEKLPARSFAFHGNLTRPVSQGFALQWQTKMSPTDQAIALEIAGPLLRDLGYPAERPAVSDAAVSARRLWQQTSAAVRWRLRRLRPRQKKS